MSDSEIESGRDLQAQARRQQIVETALRLFAEHGFDGTSTRKIAQAADISEGLIFHYFPTKNDLLNAIFETPHSFFGELQTILSDGSDLPVEQVLQRVANGWLDTLYRERQLTSLLLATAQTNAAVSARLESFIQQGTTALSTYLQKRIEHGELRADLPTRTAAHTFFASLFTFFLAHHHLSASEWNTQHRPFSNELLSVWLRGARP